MISQNKNQYRLLLILNEYFAFFFREIGKIILTINIVLEQK